MRRGLQYPLAIVLVQLCRRMPGWLVWPAATALGLALSLLPGRSRRIFRINVKHAAVPMGLRVRLWRVYRNLAAGVLDYLRLSFCPDGKFFGKVEVRGAEHMEDALSKGRGVIAITAHYSAWELIPRAVSLLGHGVGVVTRRVGRGKTAEYIDSLRSRHGILTIDRGSGFPALMRALRDGRAVGILIDQDTMGVDSDFVRFLGLEARTPVGPARIALRFGVPVLTLHISRGRNGSYTVEIDEPLDPEDYGSADGHLRLTADLTDRIGEWVIDDPEQWVWIHERWARRPGGAPGLE